MPLPVATRNVHIEIVNPPTGTAAEGIVQFVLPYPLHDATDNVTLSPGTYTATLVDGEATIALPVNDESGVTPEGWSYEVRVRTSQWTADGYCEVPSGGSTLEFADIFPSATVTTVNTYATVGQLSDHEADTTSIHGITDTAALIASTIVDAKGDLIVGTAADTVARLAVGTDGHVPFSDPAAASGIAWRLPEPDVLSSGQGTLSRLGATASQTLSSQRMVISFFTARFALTVGNLATITSGTAAGATPSLCRMGVYSVDGSGNLTLIGSCANDTTLFASQNTRYSRAVSAGFSLVAGSRYAFAVLVVTAAATPTLLGQTPSSASAVLGALAPRNQCEVSGQSDLPASIASGSLLNAGNRIWGEVLP